MLTIIISGPAGSGKSRVAHILLGILRNLRLPSKIFTNLDVSTEGMEKEELDY